MDEFIRLHEYPEDDESALEIYFSNSDMKSNEQFISTFNIKTFGKCGQKELLKQNCINRLKDMKIKIDEMIQKMKEN